MYDYWRAYRFYIKKLLAEALRLYRAQPLAAEQAFYDGEYDMGEAEDDSDNYEITDIIE